MNDTRVMVMELVLKGELPVEYVTLEELQEVEELLFEIVAAKNTPYETFEVLQ
jgi:hypothetical protein